MNKVTKLFLPIILVVFLNRGNLFCQEKVIYKTVDTVELSMEVYQPTSMEAGKLYPAIVFFFGGGWVGGTVSQFEPHAKYLSSRGMVVFLADYRVRSRHQTTPFDALKDAKSAIRYIRGHFNKWQVDPNRLVAAGGSAGGHLAAATATIQRYNAYTDNKDISAVPNALALFNPVYDNGPGGYGYDRIGAAYPHFSPLHNIRSGMPPTIVFLGTEDRLIPVETAKYFKTVVEKVGSRCDLHLYDGQPHGFFNFKNKDMYEDTVEKLDQFLISLHYLKGQPTVKKP